MNTGSAWIQIQETGLSPCLNRLAGWTDRVWYREVGEMDRMATQVSSIFLHCQGDGEMEWNVKMETGRDRPRDEGWWLQWTMSEPKRETERERQRQKGTWQSIFSYLCFFFGGGGVSPEEAVVLLGDCRSGRRDRWSAPSCYSRRIRGEDAGCMLIKQNTNWKKQKGDDGTTISASDSPPLLLPSPLQETRVWWALIMWWLAQLSAELHRLSDFKTFCLSVCLSGCQSWINYKDCSETVLAYLCYLSLKCIF